MSWRIKYGFVAFKKWNDKPSHIIINFLRKTDAVKPCETEKGDKAT